MIKPLQFDQQLTTHLKFFEYYTAARNAGFIRGAYHLAKPREGPGAAQARFFLSVLSRFPPDNSAILPGMLRLEGECLSNNPQQTVSWIQEFVTTYSSGTGRRLIINTDRDWWQRCTGNSPIFKSTTTLNQESLGGPPIPPPGTWTSYNFWQYDDSNPFGDNLVRFKGDFAALLAYAASKG